MVFTASFADESQTKVYVDETLQMHWDANDMITVFNGTDVNEQYRFTGEQGALGGDFVKVETGSNGSEGDGETTSKTLISNYAFYPYNANVVVNSNANFNQGYYGFNVSIPSEQKYTENSFDKNANVMAAVTSGVEDFNLKFMNIGSYLVLRFYGKDATVKSIKMQIPDGSRGAIAGSLVVGLSSFTGGMAYKQSSSGTSKTITLDCGAGVELGETEKTAVDFWFVVLPSTVGGSGKGYEFVIESADGKTATLSTSKVTTIPRNNVVRMEPREIVFE